MAPRLPVRAILPKSLRWGWDGAPADPSFCSRVFMDPVLSPGSSRHDVRRGDEGRVDPRDRIHGYVVDLDDFPPWRGGTSRPALCEPATRPCSRRNGCGPPSRPPTGGPGVSRSRFRRPASSRDGGRDGKIEGEVARAGSSSFRQRGRGWARPSDRGGIMVYRGTIKSGASSCPPTSRFPREPKCSSPCRINRTSRRPGRDVVGRVRHAVETSPTGRPLLPAANPRYLAAILLKTAARPRRRRLSCRGFPFADRVCLERGCLRGGSRP